MTHRVPSLRPGVHILALLLGLAPCRPSHRQVRRSPCMATSPTSAW